MPDWTRSSEASRQVKNELGECFESGCLNIKDLFRGLLKPDCRPHCPERFCFYFCSVIISRTYVISDLRILKFDSVPLDYLLVDPVSHQQAKRRYQDSLVDYCRSFDILFQPAVPRSSYCGCTAEESLVSYQEHALLPQHHKLQGVRSFQLACTLTFSS